MRSWVLLLLLLSAALLRLGSAEGDPLPPSLVDLVRNSPISSVDDLKLLLQQEANAIGNKEEDEHDTLADHTHGRYARSLMEAQPAQQAVCKVRTEVMEVKRSMLDRHNANFMLWPPCVEVQRCSGCCNNRLVQCVPTVTSSRNLQVIKIQYVNMKPKYEKAIITVEDHITCRCQFQTPAPQPPPSLSHSQGLPRSLQPGSQKTLTSKADLHRHDDLKHNQQRHHPEEQPVAKQWQQGSSAHWTRLHQSPAHAQPGVYQ
uniref:Platelet-derived growth factor beta polypeptide a n=1 Tax=Tetraodon nigroviridis TaxID=99883 RepID=H3DNC1_TETNG